MPAYTYTTKIDYGLEKIRTEKAHYFPTDTLTIAQLSPIVGANCFTVEELHYEGIKVHWVEERSETSEEMESRINRLEAYNAEVLRRKKSKTHNKE